MNGNEKVAPSPILEHAPRPIDSNFQPRSALLIYGYLFLIFFSCYFQYGYTQIKQ